MSKTLNIAQTQKNVGWIYSGLNWLAEEETQKANKQRNKLLSSILNSKKAKFSFMKNKLHVGNLSPGCVLCGQGYWSCLFINGLCTADCFYCPQDRTMKDENLPQAEHIRFNDPGTYANYLEKFGFRGVGFSGGEPFLAFEKVLSYLGEIKKRFGKNFYVWIYTNGDLIDTNKLKELKRAGLDEIRFDLSARNYDLRCVESAVPIIRTVTVEIPAIPEDLEKLKKCLSKIKRIGTKHLNLHQLLTSEFNYQNFNKRGYTFLRQQGNPILESEMAALNLMKFTLENEIDLPINYCSCSYKERLQNRGWMERVAFSIKEKPEEVTRAGYIRSLAIYDSPENIKKIVRKFKTDGFQSQLWAVHEFGTKLLLHGSLLKSLDLRKNHFSVTYSSPALKPALDCYEEGKGIVLGHDAKVFFVRKIAIQYKGMNPVTMATFYKLFIEKEEEKKATNYFYTNYNLATKEHLRLVKNEKDSLMKLKEYEFLKEGFPDIY